jgi:hypothetical protein
MEKKPMPDRQTLERDQNKQMRFTRAGAFGSWS